MRIFFLLPVFIKFIACYGSHYADGNKAKNDNKRFCNYSFLERVMFVTNRVIIGNTASRGTTFKIAIWQILLFPRIRLEQIMSCREKTSYILQSAHNLFFLVKQTKSPNYLDQTNFLNFIKIIKKGSK